MCETSLSMGPRGGPADPYSRALAGGLTPSPIGGQRGPSQQQGAGAFQFEFPYPSGSGSQAQALASNPVSPPTRNRLMRSSSAPTSAPEPAPTIPALQDMPRISLFPATPFSGSRDSVNTARPGTSGEYSSASGGNRPPTSSSATFGAPLRRQRSAPMYHRALQEQVEQEREESRSREAQRLGVPVIGVVGRDSGERGSYGSEISSEMSFGSEDVEIGIEDEEKEEGREGGLGYMGRRDHLRMTMMIAMSWVVA
ncbi:uncharacterized protein LY89DRAFT_485846 [Mollisia scopiformis]|uniref:Uncharacterized protein n=1 Tax=Mollisia scopiformis TaxID=149040 RepID=A0A194XGG7_MOLSC|nr:uncharacterized protein LY89DRAFT_485846 [Mollisia scopiformis]KUJ19229.1 hypothetical protein LY89DRAFT_485846 [Mollisia scopiformis]